MNKEKKCNLSCSECAIRNCYRREKQYPAFCLTEEYRDAADRTRKLYESDGIDGRLARAAAEIEGEYYGRLTRLEETIRFALKLGVKKLGIASCIGLLDEASIYARIVRTAGIETKTVICKVGAIDVPKDNRRMHKVPIPRMGGLAIFLAFLLSVLVFAEIDRQMQGILLGAIMIVILGVLDDIMALKALPKLFVQIAAAGVAVWHGCRIQFISNPNVFSEATYLNLGWLSIPVTIIWIVAITNAVNFIDGLDGLAVGVSAISTASLIVIALMVKEVNIVIILCALFGACLGFIPYNMNPAKIFMGDTGSTFLGYILATLSITGLFKMYAIISFAVPFLILGIPIFDICFAFLRRIAHGQNPMKADRGHFHHRLIDMGFSQKQSVAIAYMLTGMLGLAAVLLTSSGELKALILIAAIFIVSAIGFRLIFSKNDPAEDASSPEPEEKQEEPHE